MLSFCLSLSLSLSLGEGSGMLWFMCGRQRSTSWSWLSLSTFTRVLEIELGPTGMWRHAPSPTPHCCDAQVYPDVTSRNLPNLLSFIPALVSLHPNSCFIGAVQNPKLSERLHHAASVILSLSEFYLRSVVQS